MVRAGLGITGFAALAIALGASAVAWGAGVQPVSADASPLVLRLAPETFRVWLFAVLTGAGIVMQIAGLLAKRPVLAVLGAGSVCCAGVLDYDPVLVVGQLAAVAALLPLTRRATQSRNTGKRMD